jgi:PPK2 family polyphosphate:nucleotide phosphotransferase
MELRKHVIAGLAVAPGTDADLAHRSTREAHTGWRGDRGESNAKDLAAADLAEFTGELSAAQDRLFASGTRAVLVILQGMDGAGKDGTIKHVMSGVNPQGCDVFSFGIPSTEELSHDFLWRCVKALPALGRIGIFDRSYYEEVLVTRVHPELLDAEHLSVAAASGDALWTERFEDINAFERHLSRNGTLIVKLFLHVSADEQKKRLLARLDDPAKHWKFSAADVAERAYFDDYMRAYEAMITATSTSWAPWYVVPADRKYESRAIVGGILADVIGGLDLALPQATGEQAAALEQAKRALEAS